MADTRKSCPYCGEESLPTSVGRTGLERAEALLRRAAEALPDPHRDLIRACQELAERVRLAVNGG